MRLRTIFAVITVVSGAVLACSGPVQLGDDGQGADASGEEAGSGDDGSRDASLGDVGIGGQDASTMDGEAGGCQGTAPNCYGNDTGLCCGGSSGPASCVNGAWMCGSSPAPGCDDTICGTDASADASIDAPDDDVNDASTTLDAGPCGWTDDAGQHPGPCAQGGQCCPGGAIGVFICYSGDGPCPAFP
jgi:hypothetical protein